MGILCSYMCDCRDLWRLCTENARLIHVLEADLGVLVLRGSVMEIMGSGHNNTVLHNRNRSYGPGHAQAGRFEGRSADGALARPLKVHCPGQSDKHRKGA